MIDDRFRESETPHRERESKRGRTARLSTQSRIALLLLLVLGLQGCAHSGPLTGTKPFVPDSQPVFRSDGVRLASLNAEFLFDGLDNEGEATFPHKGNPELARRHRDDVGKVLRSLDADIILLVEVENLNTLELLIAESLAGLEYRPFLVQGTDVFTGQNVGILSRIPLDSIERSDLLARGAADAELQNVSKNLIARLTLGGVPTSLIGLHLLARPSDPERLVKRQGQAEVIRQLVAAEIASGREVIVAGDFNDFDDDVPDRNGNNPITDVLGRIKSAGPGPNDDLTNLIGEVRQADRYTALWDRNRDERADMSEFSAIDHVLVSRKLYRRVREVRYVHTYDPFLVTDHFPIVVSFATDTSTAAGSN